MLRVSGILISLWLSLGVAWAQSGAALLARPVQPGATNAPLAQVLAELSRQSGVPFSYSSSRIGAGRRCRLRGGPPRPLGTVLHELKGPHRLAYGLLNGQLILWPATEAAPPGVREINSLGRLTPVATAPAALPRLALPAGPGVAAMPGSVVAPTARAGKRAGRGNAAAVSTPAPVRPAAATPAPNLSSSPAPGASPGVVPRTAARLVAARPAGSRSAQLLSEAAGSGHRPGAATPIAAAGSVRSGRSDRPPIATLLPRVALAVDTHGTSLPRVLPAAPAGELPSRPGVARRRRVAQLSFVAPLGSNWLASGRVVNDYSLNVLAGYSAGVRKIELAGLANVVRDTVQGFQAAGIANVTGTDVQGVQLAGIVNVAGGAVRGVQGAGIVNVVRDDARGVQLAGIVNIAGGAAEARRHPGQPTRLRRWLGWPRLLATDPLGQLPAAPSHNQPGLLVQAAGIANLTGTDVRGVQTASILNVARRVQGVQFGLVNIGRHVSGTQVGLVNFADSVSGASFGLINIVRHGYLHGEVWASESLPLNAVLKLGVRRYYTLLGLASEPFGSRVQWASGFGVGTAGRPRGRVTLSCDLMQWTLAGTSGDVNAARIDTRLLTQLRPSLAWLIEPQGRLQLVVSPTLNLAIAWSNDHQPQWDFGANQQLWIDTAGPQSRTRLWPGAQIGLRF